MLHRMAGKPGRRLSSSPTSLTMMAMRMRLLGQLLKWLQTHTGSSAARLAGRGRRAIVRRLRLSPFRCCTRFVKHCITVHFEPACVFQKFCMRSGSHGQGGKVNEQQGGSGKLNLSLCCTRFKTLTHNLCFLCTKLHVQCKGLLNTAPVLHHHGCLVHEICCVGM